MDILQKLVKDEYWKPSDGKRQGQREIDLAKVFSTLKMFLENEDGLHKACVNASIPHVSIYTHYKAGENLLKQMQELMEKSPELMGKASTTFEMSPRETEQLGFYLDVQRAQNISVMRAKKYLGYTLEQAEKEIEKDREARLEPDPENPRGEFIPNPEVLKTAKWLLERRERDRYAAKTIEENNEKFTFNVQFEDLPALDVSKEFEGEENNDPHAEASEL